MGHSGDRPFTLRFSRLSRLSGRLRAPVALVAGWALLAAACSGGDARAGGGPSLDEPAGGNATDVRAEDRCDLSFNTARFNESTELVHHHADHHDEIGAADFTLEDWADVFVDRELGMGVDEVLAELDADDIYRRHVLGGVLAHRLGPDPWMPMTEGAQCEALAGELRQAREAAARYPTVADALAAGYTRGDRYYAGLGVHYQNWELLGDLDPAHPVQLLYDGMEDDARLVGLSYVVRQAGDVPPEGFAGDNDRWHRHRHFCLDPDDGDVNLSSDVLSEQECTALGGLHVPNADGWMLHVWVAPGCESDWGIFSGANPRLPYLPEGVSLAPGCGSGRTLVDELDLDERGSGPTVN
jgi:hypothetical protein